MRLNTFQIHNYLDKSSPAKCEKCAGQLKKKTVCRILLNAHKCVKFKVMAGITHAAISRSCPVVIKEQNLIQKRTNYSHEKKNESSPVLPERVFTSACLTHILYLIFYSKFDINFITETRQVPDVSPAFTAATP